MEASSRVIRFAIVGHVDRTERVLALHDEIADQGAHVDAFVDGIQARPRLGAAGNHRRALAAHEDHVGHVVVLEDDTILDSRFVSSVHEWIARHPDDLVSFYLGTGHPEQWQPKILKALVNLDRDHIVLPKLIHAVCYAMPTGVIPDLLKVMKRTGNIDYNIGDAWRKVTRRDVIYTVPSLVDHDDDLPSLLRRRRHPRRAHRLA